VDGNGNPEPVSVPDADQLRRLIGKYYDEGVARSRRSLRAPDEAVEPEDEGVYLGERNGIYIIDLQKTLKMFKEASKFVQDLAADGRIVLFVAPSASTGRDCRRGYALLDVLRENQRWLGGLLTNWVTVQKSRKASQGTRRNGPPMAVTICFRKKK